MNFDPLILIAVLLPSHISRVSRYVSHSPDSVLSLIKTSQIFHLRFMLSICAVSVHEYKYSHGFELRAVLECMQMTVRRYNHYLHSKHKFSQCSVFGTFILNAGSVYFFYNTVQFAFCHPAVPD